MGFFDGFAVAAMIAFAAGERDGSKQRLRSHRRAGACFRFDRIRKGFRTDTVKTDMV
jgi:hypothetical protein